MNGMNQGQPGYMYPNSAGVMTQQPGMSGAMPHRAQPGMHSGFEGGRTNPGYMAGSSSGNMFQARGGNIGS